MIILKTAEEIQAARECGRLLSSVLGELIAMVRPGATTLELDTHAEKRMRELGGEPCFKGYKTPGDPVPFPSTVCTSINDEVVHAPADPPRVYRQGDLAKLDIGMRYKGMCTDMAVTVPVGNVSEEAKRLIAATRESLMIGVGKCVNGGVISDIGKAVDKHVVAAGFSTVKALVGHGVGRYVHEDPHIPNFFDPDLPRVRIVPGMLLAIEPMVNAGRDDVRILKDGWTIIAADKRLSAHFEVTLAVTENGTEIVTPLPDIPSVG